MLDRNLMKLQGMRAVLGALVVFALLQAAAIAGQAFTLSNAVANLWAGASCETQVLFVSGFLACFVLLNIVRFAQDTMLDRFSLTTAQSLRIDLIDRAFDANEPLAGKVGTASVAISATEGIDEVQTYLRIIPPKVVGIAVISIPLLVYVYTVDFVSGIILTVLFPVIVLFMVLLGRQARDRASRQYGTYRQLSNRFIDTLRGMDAIESFGAGDKEETDAYRFSEKLRAATIRTLSTATLSSAVLDLCATFGVAAVSIMLAFRLMDGSIALAPALCALMLAPEYFTPIRTFASDFHASLDGKNALAAVLDMIEVEETGSPERDSTFSVDSMAIEFEDVSFTYPGETTPALSHVNLSIAEGEHVAVVGKSGAGKSTLASLAAGLLKPDGLDGSGVRTAHSHVRFVPQHPYLFRATLEDNIRFYAPKATREEVLDACAAVGLDEFVAQLPDGLDTQVGEGARGLSGGQAHRVALARILLDDKARILVFDEPTAHLDIETELELKARMLPVMEGKTVLFATHRLHWVDDMDRVITLDEGAIASDESTAIGKTTILHERLIMEEYANSVPKNATRETASTSCEGPSCDCPSDSTLDIPWLRRFLSKYKRHVVVALALGLASSCCAAMLMFTSGFLISTTATPGITLFAILLPVAFVQVFGLGRPLARYLERLVSHDWVLRIASDLRRSLYRSIRARSGDPSRSRSTGEYLSILDDDIAHLQNLNLRVAFPAAIAYLSACAVIVLFAVFSLPFALAIAALLALCTIPIPLIARGCSANHAEAAKQLRSAEYTTITDDVFGATDWILAGRCSDVLTAHSASDARYRAESANVRLAERCGSLAITVLLGCMICIVLWWAAETFGGGSGSNPNWIAAFALGLFPLIEQFAALPLSFVSFAEHQDAVSRIGDYIEHDMQSASNDGRSETETSRETDSSNSTPSDAAVTLDGIAYTYPLSPTPALEDLSLEILQGQKVAILGKSGSGKTTVANMVRGLLQPDAGRVFIDGRRLDACVVSRVGIVGYLPQSPYLFNRTLRDNITLGVLEKSDEELSAILENVRLSGLLASLPEGLNTIIGETGRGVSGGEAHRIALARVLAANTPIVLVDEPFSALDPETESDLLDTLFAVTTDKTLVVITHHLSQIERFDRVVFVEDGKVDLDGAPCDLAQSNARFRALLEFDRR